MPDFVRPLLRAAIATALATAAGARLGLRGVPARDGLKLGAAVTAVIAAGVAAGTTAPPVRAGMIDRTPPGQGWGWLAWQIPVGTVWTEDLGNNKTFRCRTITPLTIDPVGAIGVAGADLSPAI